MVEGYCQTSIKTINNQSNTLLIYFKRLISDTFTMRDYNYCPPSTYLLQKHSGRLVYGSANISVLARVANEGPGHHSYHGQTQHTVTCE